MSSDCSQSVPHCQPTRFLSKPFWAHHYTSPWSSLVAGPDAYQVASVWSGVSLSQRHGTVLSRRLTIKRLTLGNRALLSRRLTGLERPALSYSGCVITDHLPSRAEDIFEQIKFHWLPNGLTGRSAYCHLRFNSSKIYLWSIFHSHCQLLMQRFRTSIIVISTFLPRCM